jgi:PKD repeat protein
VVAQAGPDQAVSKNQLVTLDASASVGAQTFAWTSPAGITLSNPNIANPTFTASTLGTLMFTLTVTGPGGPSTATVTITVNPASAALANAGPNQTGVIRGKQVALDGSASTGAGTYAWSQVVAAGDPPVSLTGANTAKPTFTFPLYKFPASNGALTFKLVVTSPDGSSSNASVKIMPATDTLTIAKALYTANKKEWRIDGTSSVAAGGQFVTVHLGGLTGATIGSALVDATGGFSVRVTTNTPGVAGQTVSAESQLGGTIAGITAQIK